MKATTTRRHSRRSFFVFVLSILVGLLLSPLAASAQEDGAQEGQTQDELVTLGFETYSTVCSGCHQAGGVGIVGTFPPLLGNPRVQDADYLRTTVLNGAQGVIEVDGVEYNGVMPPFPTLSDEQLDGLVAYIQGGFQLPAGDGDTGSGLPVATGALPALSQMAIIVAFAIAVAAVGFVLAPHIVGPVDRLTMPWLDAWLRAGIIVVFFVGATVIIPSMIMQTETVTRLARPVQDVIGSGLWTGGLVGGLLALWYTQREQRI
ncbi:MAG TPA: cytochrome c [Acidimicrobiia bacterium]